MIELSDFIGFGYDLSDTQDGLKCWRIGIIFCGKHPLLLTRIQVSDIQEHGASCCKIYRDNVKGCNFTNFTRIKTNKK